MTQPQTPSRPPLLLKGHNRATLLSLLAFPHSKETRGIETADSCENVLKHTFFTISLSRREGEQFKPCFFTRNIGDYLDFFCFKLFSFFFSSSSFSPFPSFSDPHPPPNLPRLFLDPFNPWFSRLAIPCLILLALINSLSLQSILWIFTAVFFPLVALDCGDWWQPPPLNLSTLPPSLSSSSSPWCFLFLRLLIYVSFMLASFSLPPTVPPNSVNLFFL